MTSRLTRYLWLLSALLIAGLVLLSSDRASAGVSDGEWTQHVANTPPPPPPPPPPSGRRATGYAYDSSRGRLLVFGGYPLYNNDVSALDLATGVWQPINPVGPAPNPRYGATAVYDAANDRLVVFGGFDGTTQLNDVWALPLSGSPVWTQITPAGTPPAGRSFHVAIYDAPRQRMVMSGGFDGTFFHDDTWELSLGGSPAWAAISTPSAPPPGRDLAGAAFDPTSDRMLLFGGWNGTYLSDTWALSLTGTQDWSQITTSTTPPGRREISVGYDASSDQLVLFGGNGGALDQDTWALSLSGTPAWQQLAPSGTLPAARYGHASVLDPIGHRLVIFGGFEGYVHGDDAWGLSLSGAPVWTKILPPPPPPPPPGTVRNYSAVVDPVAGRMIQFGGELAFQVWTNEVVSYSLSSLASPPMVDSTVGSPTARVAPRAVWDPVRDRMLMFGGYDGLYRNEIWEYRTRPTPAWTQLATSGTPPTGRFAGGLVFDAPRDRLLMFGGYGGDTTLTSLNDLWELPLSGPSALTWNPLSPAGDTVSARWGFVMLPDPARNRVLLFGGGSDAALPTADVYSLDLSGPTPSWSLLPAGPGPSARIIHAAVIEPLGDRLVIFGGFDGSYSPAAFLNDVWALSLAGSPQWTQLHPSGPQPAGRDAITAVYDPAGARMVVAGGFNDGIGFLNDVWSLHWDAATPATASLIDSHAEPGLVRLNWFVTDAASAVVTVQRQHGADAWTTLGTPASSATDRLTFEDRSVVAGESYRYRLSLRESGSETLTDAVGITVPTGYTLELVGATPNPAIGSNLRVAFSLPHTMPARLDLIDVAGRLVASRDLSKLSPGPQTVALAEGVSLAPGMYVVRLEADGRQFMKKAVVVQ